MKRGASDRRQGAEVWFSDTGLQQAKLCHHRLDTHMKQNNDFNNFYWFLKGYKKKPGMKILG